MSKKHRIEKRLEYIIFILILLAAGCFSIAKGLFSTTIEIDPTEPEISVHIQKKPIFSRLTKSDTVVYNVYQAVMTRERSHSESTLSLFSYRVELKIHNEKNLPITEYSFLKYFYNRKLKNQINDSIQNRTPFKTTFREYPSLALGIFIIILSFLFILAKISYNKDVKKRRMKHENIDVKTNTNTELQQPTEPNSEKH